MKYSFACVSALAVTVLAAKPQFTNSQYTIEEGKPFTLKYNNCGDKGCTIILQHGDQSDLKDVKTITTDATGGSETITLDGLQSDDYNFKIIDNSSGESNYSPQFPMASDGTAPSPSPTGSASASASASSASATGSKSSATGSSSETSKATASGTKTNTKSESTGTTSKPASSTSSMKTSSASSTGSTSSASSSSSTQSMTKKLPTSSAPPTSTAPPSSQTSSTFHRAPTSSTKAPVSTTPPGSGAGQVSSPMALVAGVAMAVAYLS